MYIIVGHSIEAGWFLLDLAVRKNRPELIETAIQKFMINPFNYGWDKELGGIYYFLDVDGWSPAQLEWDMKLWWPHNEAMISFLMAYKHTKDVKYLNLFAQVFDYSYSHVSTNVLPFTNKKKKITKKNPNHSVDRKKCLE